MDTNKKTNSKKNTVVLEQTVKTLANLNSLIATAIECKTENTFIFHILNHTISYIHYDRAILISANGKKIIGVSGTSRPSKHSLIATSVKSLATSLSAPNTTQIISDDSFVNLPNFWKEYKEKSEGTSLLWIPLILNNTDTNQAHQNNAILIFERWNNRPWKDSDINIIAPIQRNFSNIWRLHRKGIKNNIHKKGRHLLILLLLIISIIFLHSYKISERIVAPCEVAPEDPYSVTTAIDGVIEEVLVHPGQRIEKNSILVELNQDIFNEELTAARQQIKITQSELSRTQAQAVTDLEARGQLATLKNQLKMDNIRLRLAEYKMDKSKILAPNSGVVMMNDPHEWEGKPVMTGERIMLIITPSNNKIKIYLPLDDKIDFPENAMVKVILNTDSATSREAHLTYISDHATVSPKGIPAFLAEAKFDSNVDNIRMGIQGTAVIYGKKVSLGYWLIRRPLAAIRNFIGI